MMVVKIDEPNGTYQTYSLGEEGQWVVGRALDNDMCVPVRTVSRKHLVLQASEGNLYVRLFEDSKVATLNGKNLGTSPIQLGRSDRVEFGGATLSVLTEEEEATLQDVINPLSQHWEEVWLAYCPEAERALHVMRTEPALVVTPHEMGNGLRPTVVMYVLEGGHEPVCAVKSSPFWVEDEEGNDIVVRSDILWTPRLEGFSPLPADRTLLPSPHPPIQLRSHTGLELPEVVAIYGAAKVHEHGQWVIRQKSEPLVVAKRGVK